MKIQNDIAMMPLTKGYVTKIDASDALLVAGFNLHATVGRSGVYAIASLGHGNKKMCLHRMIMSAPDGIHVDHINGDTLDNRRDNLRLATAAQNSRNCKPVMGGTSEMKGVSWHKASNRWRAQIRVETKKIHLGIFKSEADAYAAYCDASDKYHGEFGRTA